ncbi:MAG: tetratricopeptide repeat protein [Myxococcota bacterium]
MTATGGMNLYVGHHARADGTFFTVPSDFAASEFDSPEEQRDTSRRVAEERTGRALSAGEVSSYWRGEALRAIAAGPARWLRLELRKLALFANAGEVWNDRAPQLEREFSWVMRLPLPGFGVVAPLAFVGMALCARRAPPPWRAASPWPRRALWPLYASVLVALATALAFFVLARYRFPVVPALLLFAAAALVDTADALRARHVRRVAARALALAALLVVAHLPIAPSHLHVAHFNLANRYRARGDLERAVAHYEAALRIAARHLASIDALARTLEELGRRDRAIAGFRYLRDVARERGAAAWEAHANERLRALGADAAGGVDRATEAASGAGDADRGGSGRGARGVSRE